MMLKLLRLKLDHRLHHLAVQYGEVYNAYRTIIPPFINSYLIMTFPFIFISSGFKQFFPVPFQFLLLVDTCSWWKEVTLSEILLILFSCSCSVIQFSQVNQLIH